MEKINTPLGELLEWAEEKYNDLNVQSQTSNESVMQYAYAMVIDRINYLIPTEREVIENAFKVGAMEMNNLTNDRENEFSSPEDYFTQTFKSYE